MILLIILIALFFVGLFLFKKDNNSTSIFGFVIMFFICVCFIVHVLLWSTASYNYNTFRVERQAFEETLENARKNGNQIELAAITHDISKWNQQLAQKKYDRSIFLLRDYTDKRIESLQPIK